MATELPLFYSAHVPNEPTAKDSVGGEHDTNLLTQEGTLHDDTFLQELLGTHGDDLLSTLLDPSDHNQTTDPPFHFDFDFNPLLNIPSPISSDHSASESSNNGLIPGASSPISLISGSDGLGDSPATSPNLVSSLSGIHPPSTYGVSDSVLGDYLTSSGLELSDCLTTVSPDIRIDVDVTADSGHLASPSSSTTDYNDMAMYYCDEDDSPNGTTNRKAHTLFLTEDEKKLLAEEGITLPTDMPLTKAEQKHLKRIRRKIKNKISAQESRKRKKVYVDGLENRVKICTDRNRQLKKEVDCLKQDNVSLISQLKKLQAMIAHYNPSRVQAGSVLLVIVMSFSLFIVPNGRQPGRGLGKIGGFSRSSRTLLFAETDEFGNVIDPDNGLIISRAGGHSPNFPPPWIHQTPSPTLFSLRTKILPDNFHFPRYLGTKPSVQTDPMADRDGKGNSNDPNQLNRTERRDKLSNKDTENDSNR